MGLDGWTVGDITRYAVAAQRHGYDDYDDYDGLVGERALVR